VKAELFFDPDNLIARRIGGHDDGADTLLACRCIRNGKNNDDIAILTRGDELLRAIKNIVIAIATRPGLEI